MIVNETELDKLVELIFTGVRSQRWLYYPPGPMMGQVFDRNICKCEIRRFLEASAYPIVEDAPNNSTTK